MTVLNWAKSRTALWLAGSSTAYPTYYMIGDGSGATTVTMTSLVSPWDRQEVTSSNGSFVSEVTWTGDWNSVELSGNQLMEWGMCASGATTTGSIWSRTGMGTAITFDGTIELRIEESWEVY